MNVVLLEKESRSECCLEKVLSAALELLIIQVFNFAADPFLSINILIISLKSCDRRLLSTN